MCILDVGEGERYDWEALNRSTDYLINADKRCDLIPLMSTVTNLIAIFQKGLMDLAANVGFNSFLKVNYYFYLKNEKSYLRCVVLLVPVLGNLSIFIYDFFSSKAKSRVESPLRPDPSPNFEQVKLETESHEIGSPVAQAMDIPVEVPQVEVTKIVKAEPKNSYLDINNITQVSSKESPKELPKVSEMPLPKPATTPVHEHRTLINPRRPVSLRKPELDGVQRVGNI